MDGGALEDEDELLEDDELGDDVLLLADAAPRGNELGDDVRLLADAAPGGNELGDDVLPDDGLLLSDAVP
ncbi:hypothetical protein FACS189449_00200 [Alphaproteobacteria bacterium]|nr:hypothetical protein FACS189449_00200 [Alphaproteobacteria bacterium]